MSPNPERINNSPERGDPRVLEEAGEKRREELRDDHERSPERTERSAEELKQEALEAAKSPERERTHEKTKAEREPSPAERRQRVGKAEREASFKAVMTEVQEDMSAPSRAFSKVIHQKAVEKASNGLGATIARPNAILSGAVAAFIVTLAVYVIAKNLGYPLSGFETIAAFILGWVIGICYDFLRVMITGRHS